MAKGNGKRRNTGAALPETLAADLRAVRSPERAMELLLETDRTQQGLASPCTLGDLVGATVEELEPGAITAGPLESVSPSTAVSSGTRLQMIAGLDRQIARLQAQQAEWIASFARPGVAASYPELLDMAVLGKGTRMDTDELLEILPDRLQDDPDACDQVLSRHPDWQAELNELAGKVAAHELGAVLGVAPISAGHRIRQSRTLIHDYPRTFESMLAGHIDRLKANLLIEELETVSPELRGELEESVLPQASSFTAGRWAKRLRKWVIETDPEAARRRAERAARNRKVRVTPTDTDAARFSADLPADQALLAWAVLNHTAGNLPDDIRAGRSLDQLRADVFAGIFSDLAERGHVDLRHPDLLPGSLRTRPPTGDQRENQNAAADEETGREPAEPWSPCIAATVTIGASTLAGLDNDPAALAGYGWITAGLGRALAASASSLRLVVQNDTGVPPPDPPPPCADRPGHGRCSPDAESPGLIDRACGTDLDYGRAVYRPPTAVDDRVRQRDQVCRFFGCTRPAEYCDLDHRTPFAAGGPTCPCNLDGLCRPHHRAKTFLQWRAIRLPANHLRWTTPHGYVVDDHPEPQPLGTRFTVADLQATSAPPPRRGEPRPATSSPSTSSPPDDPPPSTTSPSTSSPPDDPPPF